MSRFAPLAPLACRVSRREVALFALLALSARPAGADTEHPRARSRLDDVSSYEISHGIRPERAVAPAALTAAFSGLRRVIPSFSRQTGLPCSACHYQFPQLTAFGRLFKLNGYTMTGLQTIGQPGDSAGHESLKLSPIPLMSAMLVASVSHTSRAAPGTQNGTAQLPQEFSIFAAGELTPNAGMFTQFTYAGLDGSFGVDNIDVRLAKHGSIGTHDVLAGLTLHNNPTIQDVWNTVPAWGFPFMGSEVAPSAIASTLIDGALAQRVLGLGAYSLIGNTLYGEVTAYRSAPQGGTQPLDSSATDVIRGVVPYWRLALQRASPSGAAMIGTYGFGATLYPTGVSGATDRYLDVAVDAQLERKVGAASWVGRASWIHERQRLDASASASPPAAERAGEHLEALRASLSFQPSLRYGLNAGYFQTTGSSDAVRFAPGDLTGSRTGSPDTRGAIGELDYNPWQNFRVGLQYVGYARFNGSSSAYDVVGGRRAADNNTLYGHLWVAF